MTGLYHELDRWLSDEGNPAYVGGWEAFDTWFLAFSGGVTWTRSHLRWRP